MAICPEVSGGGVVPRVANPVPMRLEESGIREAVALERLYLVAAVALLYGTSQGMAVQIAGLRPQVDPKKATGHQLSRALGCAGSKVSSTRDAHCSPRFHSYPKTHSRASPLALLSKTTITKSGSLASVRYRVGLDSLMIHKDVSGSQGKT